ncbi:MAG: hypothetical protein U5N53_22980 [Mycobacterium sp.]|nr:hypothetical protein [Mycobacterium sp.]
MVELAHPLSKSTYHKNDDATVRVVGKGVEGNFDRDGKWLSGQRRTCDPAMAQWVADGRANGPVEVMELSSDGELGTASPDATPAGHSDI